MRPIVHIGFHKTATTWLQRSVYPKSMSHRWVPRERARRVFLDPFGLSFCPETARVLLHDDADPRPIAICEENLSGYLHNGGLHGMVGPEVARRIKATLPDAKIVIVIRSQPDMIAASYVQYVRGGGTHGPGRYLFAAQRVFGAFRHPYKAPRFAFEHFEYDRLVGYYDALFGRENVLVLPYELLKRSNREFIETLKRETGLQLNDARIDHRRANRSFGLITLFLGRLLGLFTARSVVDKACLVSVPGFYEVRRVLLNLVARFDRPCRAETLLGRATMAHVRERYATSNRRLLAMRDLDLAALGYPVGDVAEEEIERRAVSQPAMAAA